MKYSMIECRADLEKLQRFFKQKVPRSSDDLENGEIYGSMQRNKIELYYKTQPRTIMQCVSEYLYAEVDEDGNIRYCYKPTFFRILLMIAPGVALFLGVLIGLIEGEALILLCGIIFAILSGVLLLFKPKSRREQLQSYLSHVVECSMGKEDWR